MTLLNHNEPIPLHAPGIENWPVAKLAPHPLNPRGLPSEESVQDLAANVKVQGVLSADCLS